MIVKQLYNSLRVIFYIFILSQSFFVYASQESYINEASKAISSTASKEFEDNLKETDPILDEIAELNILLTSAKVSQIPNFEELCYRKFDLLEKLIKNPDFKNLKYPLMEESFDTSRSMKDPDYIPYLPPVTVIGGKRAGEPESQKSIDNKIDKINEELGRRVLLKRSDYVKRIDKENIPPLRQQMNFSGKCGYSTIITEEEKP